MAFAPASFPTWHLAPLRQLLFASLVPSSPVLVMAVGGSGQVGAGRLGPASLGSQRSPGGSRSFGGGGLSDTATLDLPSLPRAPRPEIADLVRRCQDGEVDAFGELYDRYADLVFRYVFYRVGNTSVAEDIVSDTFLRALRRIDSFTWQGTDIGAWFVTIARNLIVDHARSSRVRLEFPTDDVLAATDEPTDVGPEETVLTVIQNRLLLDAVRTLSPAQQECIVLRFLEGLSIAETAQIMNRPENAIKQLQLRAVRALARHLGHAPH